MQLYLIPVIAIVVSLFLAGSRSVWQSKLIALTLTLFIISSFVVLITFYQGINSDWQTYREYVEICNRLGCTYFEPGFDLLTFVSAETYGFWLIKVFLLLCYVASVAVAMGGTARPFMTIVAVASVSIAALPLMLGAIRQSLTLPLLLWAATLLAQQRYSLTLLAVAIASSLHYSALVVSLWYGILWYLVVLKPRSRLTAPLRVIALIFGTYAVLYMITNSGLADAFTLVGRIGETGVGTDSINTGGLIRDIVILGERLPFAVVALVLLNKQNCRPSQFSIERVFLLMYIAGTAFFISTYEFDRNIAGRTLATFRIADVFVIVATVRHLLGGSLSKIANLSALGIAILFVVSKSYMTLVTVGFFDE